MRTGIDLPLVLLYYHKKELHFQISGQDLGIAVWCLKGLAKIKAEVPLRSAQ